MRISTRESWATNVAIVTHRPDGDRRTRQSRTSTHAFPLLGSHALADCRDCHKQQEEKEFVNTPTECYACHQAEYERAREPDHVQGRFDRNCAACHDLGNPTWTGGFVHPTQAFMQTPAHIGLVCADCHVNGYSGTPTDCSDAMKLIIGCERTRSCSRAIRQELPRMSSARTLEAGDL